MFLTKVRIQNFKSIIDTGWVYLSQGDLINILAGQNESGKTAFLRALRFFEEGPYGTFEDEDRRMEENPQVDCTFALNEDEYIELKTTTNKKIADYVKKNNFTFSRWVDKDNNFKIGWMGSEEFKSLVKEYNDVVEQQKEKNEDIESTANKFTPFDYFDFLRPKMVFYSSFADNILPGKISYEQINKNQAVRDFESVYKVNFKELLDISKTNDQKRARAEERIRTEAANSLNQYWRQIISGEKVNYKFAITVRPDSTITNSYVNFYINQGDELQLSVSQKSQGFQWFMGFNLRLRAHEQALDINKIILLIDEPGQGLHEIAQADVKAVLEELAGKSKIQIIYSTHQPILLGSENIQFSRLLLVDRNKKEGSKFKTISQLISSSGNKDSLSPIQSALGLVSIKALSLSSKVLISEGITEYFYLKTLFCDLYTIIPSTGVDQIPNIFAILFGWGIDAKVIIDDDMQGRKAYNKIIKEFFGGVDSEEFKEVAFLNLGYTGIEDMLSKTIITDLLKKFGKKYTTTRSKVENVEQVGKYIFAKTFFDKYFEHLDLLDGETISNFNNIKKFLNIK